jgi:hypothetical protein
MNAAGSAQVVRRWVRIYTLGLPEVLRDARRAEIESDLWSQREEADLVARSGESLATEILFRLALGIPDDIAWRISHARAAGKPKVERSADMRSRVVALLAVLGGIGLTVGFLSFVSLLVANPDVVPWWHLMDEANPVQSATLTIGGELGMIALGAATVGLVVLFPDRLGPGGALAGSIGGLSGIVAELGVYLFVLLLPIGSAIVVWDLARKRAIGRPLAILFIGSAIAFVVPLAVVMGGRSPIGATVVLLFLYPLAWVAVGGWLARGIPRVEALAPGV